MGPLGAVFGGPLFAVPTPAQPVWRGPVPPMPAVPAAPKAPAFLTASGPVSRAARRVSLPIEVPDDEVRQAKLARWAGLARLAGDASSLGRQLAEAASDGERARILENTFGPKSSATLGRRATAISLFLRWATASGFAAAEVLPPTEEITYR